MSQQDQAHGTSGQVSKVIDEFGQENLPSY